MNEEQALVQGEQQALAGPKAASNGLKAVTATVGKANPLSVDYSDGKAPGRHRVTGGTVVDAVHTPSARCGF